MSFSTTGGTTNDGVDCANELLVIEIAVVCAVGVDAVFSDVDEMLSAEVAVEKSWSSADGVEKVGASVVALEEVEDIVTGVEVWISSKLVAVADRLENRGAMSRLCQS